MILKRMGVVRGVSDLFLSIPKMPHYAGFWLEAKIKPNKASKEQMAFLSRKEMQGYKTLLFYTKEEAQQAIKEYMAM